MTRQTLQAKESALAKKSSFSWLRPAAAHPAAEAEHEAPSASSPAFAHDFTKVPVRPMQLPGVPGFSCPFAPQRCPSGGACHTCPPKLQAKLKIGQPGDQYEQEADCVAETVMRMPEPQVQRKGCSAPGCKEEDEDKKLVQTKPAGGGESRAYVDRPLIQSVLSSPGQPLDAATRSFMEPRFGQDFSGVRVHLGGEAAESARAVNARAYTVGRDVVFGEGQYAPGTDGGKRLVAHELVHVGQQLRIEQHELRCKGKKNGSSVIVKPGRINFVEPDRITSNPDNVKRHYAHGREIVRAHCDNCLDYFSTQYLSGMNSFKSWYQEQEKADASFFNAVVNIIMNSAWAWGSPAVGAVVAPVGSIIMLVAQESARVIQTTRDGFFESLSLNANNFQAEFNRRLRGSVPEIIEKENPKLWNDIEQKVYEVKDIKGGDWKQLLYDKAGLPIPGKNYQTKLLSQLIFEYRKWELSKHTDMYRGIYSTADPYLEHMENLATAEGYIKSGLPIPKRLAKYAHPGERIAEE